MIQRVLTVVSIALILQQTVIYFGIGAVICFICAVYLYDFLKENV